jgi:hypothetical protein
VTARRRASDLVDLAGAKAVPYVDFFLTDAAMMTYCRQAAAEIGRPYPQLFGNFREVVSHLGFTDEPMTLPAERHKKRSRLLDIEFGIPATAPPTAGDSASG